MRHLFSVIGFALACLAAPVAMAEAGLTVTAHGDWSLAVVSNDGRAAGSIVTGSSDTPAALIAKSDDSDFVTPVFKAPSREETIGRGRGRVAIMVDGVERAAAIVETGFDDEGALVIAYPGVEDAPAVIAAMQAGRELSLVDGARTLVALPLRGFDEAWRALVGICG
ncbi:MAG: hypothetical protein ACK5MQ_07110 [Pikeienuella sp.]